MGIWKGGPLSWGTSEGCARLHGWYFLLRETRSIFECVRDRSQFLLSGPPLTSCVALSKTQKLYKLDFHCVQIGKNHTHLADLGSEVTTQGEADLLSVQADTLRGISLPDFHLMAPPQQLCLSVCMSLSSHLCGGGTRQVSTLPLTYTPSPELVVLLSCTL